MLWVKKCSPEVSPASGAVVVDSVVGLEGLPLPLPVPGKCVCAINNRPNLPGSQYHN